MEAVTAERDLPRLPTSDISKVIRMDAIDHRVSVAASPEAIFALYADVPGWSQWDPEVEHASLDGPFETGSRGRLKPTGGPAATISLAEVIPGRSFTAESSLPLCRMVFEHELNPSGVATEAVHRVRFVGPLAWVFRRLIGKGLDAGLPRTLDGLKAAAEKAGASESYA